jgi:hypothetical protein
MAPRRVAVKATRRSVPDPQLIKRYLRFVAVSEQAVTTNKSLEKVLFCFGPAG